MSKKITDMVIYVFGRPARYASLTGPAGNLCSDPMFYF